MEPQQKKNKPNEYLYYKEKESEITFICPLCNDIIYKNDLIYGIICNYNEHKKFNNCVCHQCGQKIINDCIKKNITPEKYINADDIYKIVGKYDLIKPKYYLYHTNITNCTKCFNCYVQNVPGYHILCHRFNRIKTCAEFCNICGKNLIQSFINDNIKVYSYKNDYRQQISKIVGGGIFKPHYYFYKQMIHNKDFECKKCCTIIKANTEYNWVICNYFDDKTKCKHHINDPLCISCSVNIRFQCDTCIKFVNTENIYNLVGNHPTSPPFEKKLRKPLGRNWNIYSKESRLYGNTFTCFFCGLYNNGFANPYVPCWKIQATDKNSGDSMSGPCCDSCVHRY